MRRATFTRQIAAHRDLALYRGTGLECWLSEAPRLSALGDSDRLASVALAITPAICGFSCSRRSEYSYQRCPKARRPAAGWPAAHELAGPALAHTEQHLELVRARAASAATRASDSDDQPLVVRRDPDPRAAVEERLEAGDEGAAHDLGVLERDRARLDVDALAEPHARAQVARAPRCRRASA